MPGSFVIHYARLWPREARPASLLRCAATGHERVDYPRAHLPATQRERYEQELREATERALDTGDYGSLGDVVERWWRAARLEDRGGSSWQRQKRLAEEGRWDELFPGPGRDVDEVVEKLLR